MRAVTLKPNFLYLSRYPALVLRWAASASDYMIGSFPWKFLETRRILHAGSATPQTTTVWQTHAVIFVTVQTAMTQDEIAKDWPSDDTSDCPSLDAPPSDSDEVQPTAAGSRSRLRPADSAFNGARAAPDKPQTLQVQQIKGAG